MTCGYTTRMSEPFTQALVDRVREALTAQGFGVLTEIDMRATTRRWPSGPSALTGRSGCCCPAMS
jgi:hypothetical protein